MTEQEMRERMKEINKERSRLKDELEQYEDYFYNKKLEEKRKNRKEYVGKYFVPKNGTSSIKALKILEVLESPNENYARCIVLHYGIKNNCWGTLSVEISVVGLWTPVTRSLMCRDNDPLIIDTYREVDSTEFKLIYRGMIAAFEQVINENISLEENK